MHNGIQGSLCSEKCNVAGLRLLDHLTRLEVKSAAAAGGDEEADAEKKAAEKREKGEEQEEEEAEADVDDIDDEDDDYYQARVYSMHSHCPATPGERLAVHGQCYECQKLLGRQRALEL